ncbi:NACHT domain-containing protein [Actinokineospora globicatena]|uniref:NACHT domain-containing protein n=1 Tax=Actinokineospora globicatena TaxID=103729 RepID=UPI002552B0E6|nr:AAA family ATPase [Actinokineospora globicatena]
MPRQPALTFAGALEVLGKYEPKTVRALDKALGGVILAAGAGAGLAALGGAALAPLVLLWGWVDQKNEAFGLLRSIVGRLRERTSAAAGKQRRELVAAAHSIIAAAAFLDVLRERLAKHDITVDFEWPERDGSPAEDYFEALYLLEVPCPSGAWGFRENLDRITRWAAGLLAHTNEQLSVAGAEGFAPVEFVDAVALRYESHYLDLAATVPEFLVWASLGEHAATRARLAELDVLLRNAAAEHATALEHLHRLVSANAQDTTPTDLRSRLHAANSGVLDDPVVPMDAERYDTEVVFPTVEKIFLTPRYRIAVSHKSTALADDTWWAYQEVHSDLDHRLVGHLFSPEAVRVPMVLLGHPGAGKSLLTKVLAARLPVSDYTVVRVPLRSVDSGAPMMNQVQSALDRATNARVSWIDLADSSADTVRVLLLDGLDELLQASRHDRGNYLQEVADFQRIEAQQGRPVVVIVTCRTVVVDRVSMVDETVVVKLEEFSHDQLADWLRRWRTANAAGIASGAVRALSFDEAMHQADLAVQPLLLLMLALYAADPASPPLDAGLSRAALYDRIFDNFARREVLKRAKHPLRGAALNAAVDNQVTRLAIAGLAMFNRGRLSASETEIRADLRALGVEPVTEDAGARVVGEFLFVHAAEANSANGTDRSFEFLHATFGEYLVAHFAVLELRKVAEISFGGRWPSGEIADELLYAVLSHHAWPRRRSIVEFAASLFSALPEGERANIQLVLRGLIRTYRSKERSPRFTTYAPVPRDVIRTHAAYSANLITMAVSFAAPDPVRLVDLFDGEPEEALQAWRSTLSLWRSGLYGNSWQLMVLWFTLIDGAAVALVKGADERAKVSARTSELFFADLAGNREGYRLLRLGAGVSDMASGVDSWRDWVQHMVGWAACALSRQWTESASLRPSEDLEPGAVKLGGRILEYTVRACIPIAPYAWSLRAVESLLAYSEYCEIDARTLIAVAYFRPDYWVDRRQLHEPGLYLGWEEELRFALDHPWEKFAYRRTALQEVRQRLFGDLPKVEFATVRRRRFIESLGSAMFLHRPEGLVN